MSNTLKRLEKIERELAPGDEVVTKAYIVTFPTAPDQEPDPDEERAIQEAVRREIDRKTKEDGRRPEYVVVYPPCRELVYNVRPAGADRIRTDGGGEL
jgi:hypothetical protein